MILVLVGTQPHKFTRIFDYVANLIEDESITEQVIVQLGENQYTFPNSEVKTYEYLTNYEQTIKAADLIICHGGVGVIMQGLENNKKIITIPRKKELQEHIDNHQEEICQKFAKHDYILTCNSYEELKKEYQVIKQKIMKEYQFNNENFNEQLNELINILI